MGILAVDDQKWPNLLGESKNVHKAQGILEVVAISLGIFFMNFFLEKQHEHGNHTFNEKVDFINEDFSEFLDEIASKDKFLSVYIELYRFSKLVIQC